MIKFLQGDLVTFKKGKVLPHLEDRVMIVLESYKARKDQGIYYRVICNGEMSLHHSSQLKKVR